LSGATQAVFVSYSSQDAGAADRICEALRAAGFEVWFDKSELRGGDAWDQKIRQQIRDCALFLPIISRSTQARAEGYFRLEWRLADQRTHLMGRSRAFLVPICVDATPEKDADVPDSFLTVQWTRLPEGMPTPEFVARVGRLLEEPAAGAAADRPPQVGRGPAEPSSPRQWRIGVTVAVIVAAIAIAYYLSVGSHRELASPSRPPDVEPVWAVSPVIPDKSIAVLPFVDMSEKKDQVYFADGLSDELINLLAKIPDLRVAARTSAFSFRDKPSTIAEIGKALNVGHIVEGSVRKSGDSIRITVQLVQADTTYHLWSETYDRKLGDLFKVQDEIAAAVVRAMKLQLLAAALPSSGRAEHVRAYDSMLQCRFLSRSGKGQLALECFERVVAADPTYALAWAWLSLNLIAEDTQDPRVRAAAQRAIELDPKLSDAHVALAQCYEYGDFNWKQAEVEYVAALALDENNPQALRGAGRLAMFFGRFQQAMSFAKHATERDPLSPGAWGDLADAQWLAGLSKTAQDNYRRALDINPNDDDAHSGLAIALLDDGNPSLALSELGQVSDESSRLWPLAIVYFHMGRKLESDKALAALKGKYADSNAGVIAVVHAYRNENDSAFEWIARAYRQHDEGLVWLKVQKLMVNIHSDPRFREWIKKLDFPD
jgi:adenylate cyclase